MSDERFNYELPHPQFIGWDEQRQAMYQDIYLPDYITICWWSPVIEDWCEAEINPDRLEDFIEDRNKIEGEGVIFNFD